MSATFFTAMRKSAKHRQALRPNSDVNPVVSFSRGLRKSDFLWAMRGARRSLDSEPARQRYFPQACRESELRAHVLTRNTKSKFGCRAEKMYQSISNMDWEMLVKTKKYQMRKNKSQMQNTKVGSLNSGCAVAPLRNYHPHPYPLAPARHTPMSRLQGRAPERGLEP